MSEDREQTAARASPPAFANEEPALPQEASRENTPDNRLATPRSITPQQLNVKEEPIDVDIDLSLTSKDRASPNKRRRLFMDAVELTPRSQRELSSEEINQMIQGMQNPAAKKKKDDMTLSLDTIKDRLKRINYHVYDVDLEKTVQETTVTRKFMSQHYGGNTQEMHPVIKKATIERTGLKNFLYPNLEYNPYCPEMPGRPGFIFHVGTTGYSDDEESDDEERHDEEESNEQAEEGKDDAGSDEEDGKQKGTDGKVRVKRKGGEEEEEVILISRLDTNHWLYQGQYVEIDSPALSVQEWKQQSPKVKKTWIEGILDMQWGQSLRVDVGLRKRLGRQPTKAERKNALRNPAKYESKVTVDDISRALNRGELAIYPGIMKCVGYNVELQQFIVDNFVREPKPPKTEKNKTPKKPSAKGKRAPATGAKRKRDQESESEDEQPVYKSRGTHSRPIVV
ncbi:hypothetical protein FB45DRAFT_1096796 [Roridomyces roridus]|uniref:DUF6697 domain-containing protein n=1 Tax=Roridomyces roridus TaxID=1738132 RepID=A0AAD7BEB9_9AGAR|nr:hypothetical protein FB45DRAFT_1096796 [Roridomyces roridus]